MAAKPSSGVRVTVEADDSASEEVEDIGSDASSANERDHHQQQQQQQRGQRQKAGKHKSEASGAAGLANVIHGLLAKPLPSGAGCCPIMAKALSDRQRFSPAGAAAAGNDDRADGGDDVRARRQTTAERRRWLSAGRVKPSPSVTGAVADREAECELERTACRGVVQLFNAVRAQQRALDARLAGKSEAGRQRVLASLSRADFLDMLAGRKKKRPNGDEAARKVEGDSDEGEGAQRKKKSWGVLSDDYLVKPTLTMKEWDRASSDEGSGEGEQPMDEEAGAQSD